jgi:phage gpG-like protein
MNPFRKDAKKIKMLLQVRLPEKAVELAEEIVLASFEAESYKGQGGAGKWDQRKRKDKTDTKRALLVKSGDLKRSINVYYDDSQRAVIIESDKEVGRWSLAQIHNEGLDPVPQRKFMPAPDLDQSFPVWEERLTAWLIEEMDLILG